MAVEHHGILGSLVAGFPMHGTVYIVRYKSRALCVCSKISVQETASRFPLRLSNVEYVIRGCGNVGRVQLFSLHPCGQVLGGEYTWITIHYEEGSGGYLISVPVEK